MTEKLIIFTRYPEAGKTKTRLIPILGAEGAAVLHQQMTELTIAKCRKLVTIRNLSIEVFFHGGDRQLMQEWLGNELIYHPQGTGDLGAKMCRACDRAFHSGIDRMVIVGTDCPELTVEILNEAFDRLIDRDLVLGEAKDGGYYLIGLSRPIPHLFVEIDWGTEVVFQQTQKIANKLNLTIAYLPILNDVDRPEDLEIYSTVDY
jgi:uncharacterized protein